MIHYILKKFYYKNCFDKLKDEQPDITFFMIRDKYGCLFIVQQVVLGI
jgi:hypothetical protein